METNGSVLGRLQRPNPEDIKLSFHSDSTLSSRMVDLIVADFNKIYDVYLFKIKERLDSARLFIAIISSPFILLSALNVTKIINVNSDVFSQIPSLPKIVFIFMTGCGFIGLLPFNRFIMAHSQEYKMIRYLNNFRKLYYSYFFDLFEILDWKPAIECDPNNPVPRLFRVHWASAVILIMVAFNSIYIGVGCAYLDRPSWVAGAVGGILSVIAHTIILVAEFNTPDLNTGITKQANEL